MFGSGSAREPGGVGTIAQMGKRASMSDSESGGESGDLRNASKGVDAQRRHSVATESTNSKDEKRRRGSGVGHFLHNARNSLHLNNNHAKDADKVPESPLQKLSRDDPALGVPQGPNNNSAGESLPTVRSTFLVGVAEDKNKKCRRTMEDTHAFLYNFLATPAPDIAELSPPPIAKDSDDQAPRKVPASNVVETDNGYFAIFDGHAGAFAADWCGKKMHVILEDNIRNNPNTTIPELLDRSFTAADQQLDKLPLKNSGCTAVCAVLRWEDRVPNPSSATGSTAIAPAAAASVAATAQFESNDSASNPSPSPTHPSPLALQQASKRSRVLYTANVGDARCVLCRQGKALRLSYDHKGSDEHEGKRIANAGGLILNNRVNGVLAVTRALGDAYLKDLVTGHPYTTETVVQSDNDEFLILACDGLWDVCTDQEAVDLVRNQKDPQKAAKALVDFALARFSTDNLSCMVVRFDREALKQTVEAKLDPIGVEGDTVQRTNSVTEAQAIVEEARRKLSEGTIPNHGFEKPDGVPDVIREEEGESTLDLKPPPA